MSVFATVESNFPAVVTHHGYSRDVGFGITIEKVAARGREADFVIAIFRRQQGKILAVKSDAIEVGEVRVFAFLAAVCKEIQHAVFFVHVKQLGDDPIAGSNLVFQWPLARSYR